MLGLRIPGQAKSAIPEYRRVYAVGRRHGSDAVGCGRHESDAAGGRDGSARPTDRSPAARYRQRGDVPTRQSDDYLAIDWERRRLEYAPPNGKRVQRDEKPFTISATGELVGRVAIRARLMFLRGLGRGSCIFGLPLYQ